MTEIEYYIWLSRIAGIGARKAAKLIEKFGSPQDIWEASEKKLRFSGISDEIVGKIISSRDEQKVKGWSAELAAKGIRFIAINDPDYPELLKEIPAAPIGIYIRGELPPTDKKFVSIIGTRHPSEYGYAMTMRFAKELASKGVVVVSGMAMGIDSFAHEGSLMGGGTTIAVLACGADICYPRSNFRLMKKILNNGCIITEYPPGTQVTQGNFPARNRIISGLSQATLVMEAAIRSGTMHTVNSALDQGRTVMALPGNATSALSEGTNQLIKDGAKLVMTVNDIFEELGNNPEFYDTPVEYTQNMLADLDVPSKAVYDLISFDPVSFERLIELSGFSMQQTQYILTILEIRGIIKKLPGRRYIRGL